MCVLDSCLGNTGFLISSGCLELVAEEGAAQGVWHGDASGDRLRQLILVKAGYDRVQQAFSPLKSPIWVVRASGRTGTKDGRKGNWL